MFSYSLSNKKINAKKVNDSKKSLDFKGITTNANYTFRTCIILNNNIKKITIIIGQKVKINLI